MKNIRTILLALAMTLVGCLMYSQFESKAEENTHVGMIEIDGVIYVSDAYKQYPDDDVSIKPTQYTAWDFEQTYDEQGNPKYTNIVFQDEIDGLPVTYVNGLHFSKHAEITKITFPKNCIRIGGFFRCTGLTELEFPDTVENIWGFEGCTGLEKIKLSSNLVGIDGEAFSYCTKLKSVTFPKGLKRIGYGAFRGCTLLEEIIFESPNPEKIKFSGKCFQSTAIVNGAKAKGEAVVVGDGFLLDSAGLEDYVKLSGEEIRAIASYAFTDNQEFRITKLTIDGVSYISSKAFYESEINRLHIKNAKYIGVWACKNSKVYRAKIENVEKMNWGVFSGCKSLRLCDITGVKDIPERTFPYCTNLYKVVLGKETKKIGQRCFYGCTNLEKLVVESEKKIIWEGKNFFKQCDSLKKITLKSEKVSASIKNVRFPKGVKLNVPNKKKAAYRKYVKCKVV